MLEGYDDLQYLGSGSFGVVNKVRRWRDGKVFACKTIDLHNQDPDYARSEIQVLENLNHQNIVRIEDWILGMPSGNLYIFMEFCDGGDLQNMIDSRQRITNHRILSFAHQIALALAYLHNPGSGMGATLHRDLKPANVLLKRGPPGYMPTIKLADFGVARTLYSIGGTYCGTPGYMAPELRAAATRGQPLPFTTKSDIYAFGKIVEVLYMASNHSARSLDIENLFDACLNPKAAERPTAQGIVNW